MILERNEPLKRFAFLSKNKFSILSFIYFAVLSYLLRQSLNESLLDKSLFCNISLAILNSVIILGLTGLVSRTGKLSYLFILILSLIITVDMTHYCAFSSVISLGGVSSILETNGNESADAIKLFFPIALPILIVTYIIMLLATRELRSQHKVIQKSVIGIIVSFVFVASFFYVMMDGYRGRLLQDFKTSALLATQRHLGALTPLVINTNVCAVTYLNEMYKFRADVSKEKSLPAGISLLANAEIPNTVFVVIGESAFRDHHSLYGYDLPTTPFLDSLSRTTNMSFYTAVSPAAITRDALRIVLSFASPSDGAPFSNNKNLVTMANDAGYTSYWISNQNKVGVNDSYVGLISSYTNESTFFNYRKDDLELVDMVNDLYDANKKQIFFIHLKGSHLDYDSKFDEIDNADILIPAGRESEGNYDKSLHHTDRVLKTIYNTVFAKDTTSSKLLYYFSDHGEIINSGHGFRESDKLMDQFRIPFITIYQNPLNNQDSIAARYMNSNILNSCNFSYIFSESIGYSVTESVVERAKKEGLNYLHVDGGVYPFDESKIK